MMVLYLRSSGKRSKVRMNPMYEFERPSNFESVYFPKQIRLFDDIL